MRANYVLTLSCVNRPGIVAAISSYLFSSGGDIREAQQFDDAQTGRFFARIAFDIEGRDESELRAGLDSIAEAFEMDWKLTDTARRKNVLLLVSKFDHCLVDLLYRWRIGELPMRPVAIVSNHAAEHFGNIDFFGIPFHHLPVSRETKTAQETALLALLRESGAELVVLARYMQVLSDMLSTELIGRCINIHHSFLPGFKGAKPYHQAHGRGVKLIGATAHYVTPELDEGPIIEQDVERISHHDTPEELVAKGRDIERRVLARAVRYHLEDRIILNGGKTVVFKA